MSVDIQQNQTLKYVSVNNWNEVECILGVPHYLANNDE